MKRLTNFIVSKRIYILVVMLILTAVCSFLIPKVSVNSDMSKYLPNDSSMMQGLSLMEKEFPAEEDSYTIRVMFKGLGSEKKALIVLSEVDAQVIASAANIPGVKTAQVNTLNVYDILNADKFIVVKDAVSKIEEVYA